MKNSQKYLRFGILVSFISTSLLYSSVLISGEVSDDPSSSKSIDSTKQANDRRIFEDRVASILKSSAELRADKYVYDTQDMVIYYKSTGDGADTFSEYCKEIISQNDFQGILFFETKLNNMAKRETLWKAVIKYGADNENAHVLLKIWAENNVNIPMLMKFHPNGVQLLLDMAQASDVESDKRALCVRIVSEMPDPRVQKAFEKLKSDNTLINEPSAKTRKTLGDIVAECIQKMHDH